MSIVSRETQEYIKSTAKESFLILLYEGVGTAMMTTLVFNYFAIMSQGNAEDVEKGRINVFTSYDRKPDNVGLLMGMFVTIMFAARISGSHFNPIITLSYMFGNVKQGKFDRILGLLYIFAQVAGALVGCTFCTIFTAGKNLTVNLKVEPDDFFQSLILETFGAFFLVFMYLSSTEEKTKFTKDSAVQTIILSGAYMGAMMISGAKINEIRASPVNPAITSMIILYNSSSGNWRSSWVFILGDLIGSFLSLIFFRFVYQRTQEAMDEIEEEESNNGDALMDDDA